MYVPRQIHAGTHCSRPRNNTRAPYRDTRNECKGRQQKKQRRETGRKRGYTREGRKANALATHNCRILPPLFSAVLMRFAYSPPTHHAQTRSLSASHCHHPSAPSNERQRRRTHACTRAYPANDECTFHFFYFACSFLTFLLTERKEPQRSSLFRTCGTALLPYRSRVCTGRRVGRFSLAHHTTLRQRRHRQRKHRE